MKNTLGILLITLTLVACGSTDSSSRAPNNGGNDAQSPGPSPTPAPQPAPQEPEFPNEPEEPQPTPEPMPEPTPEPTPEPGPSPEPPPQQGNPNPPSLPTPDPGDQPGHGYFVATPSKAKIDRDLRTRLFIAGPGGKAVTLWQEAARGRAHRWSAVAPDDQVLLLFHNELGLRKQRRQLESWGLRVIAHVDRSLATNLRAELETFEKIVSLDLFVPTKEGSVWGLVLNDDLTKLAWRFTSDSYVQLHGPHAGWAAAPRLSDLWRVPVLGALAEVAFERLATDGTFRGTSSDDPNVRWARENGISFRPAISCARGACVRVKPTMQASPRRTVGLPFYKAFCAKNSARDCRARIAQARLGDLLAWKDAKPPKETVIVNAMKDFFCADQKDRGAVRLCGERLAEALKGDDDLWDPFDGQQARCTFLGCRPGFSAGAATSMQELKAILQGFQKR